LKIEQDALYNDIKVADALVDNLTKLKGRRCSIVN